MKSQNNNGTPTSGSSATRHPLVQGFSLTELLVVILVGSILLFFAVPSLHGMLQRYRLITATNALFMTVNLARSEAIRRGARVDIVPAGNDKVWNQGWIVFIDSNNNLRPDPNEVIVHQHGALHAGLQITARFTDSKIPYLSFDPRGRTRTHASSQIPQSGHWLLENGKDSRKIIIGFLGRARVCDPQASATC